MTATSNLRPVRTILRVVIATIVCVVLAPGVYGLVGFALGNVNREMPLDAMFGPVWLLASGITLLAILLVGVPAFLSLRRRGIASYVAAAIVGGVVGLGIFVIMSATVLERFALPTGLSLIVAGIVVGILFRSIAGQEGR